MPCCSNAKVSIPKIYVCVPKVLLNYLQKFPEKIYLRRYSAQMEP